MDEVVKAAVLPRAENSCGGCVACCKVLGVPSIEKKPMVWCQHCLKGKGCAIYEARPLECVQYQCIWRSGVIGSREDLRPDKLKVLFDVTEEAVFLESGQQLIVATELLPGALREPMPRQLLEIFSRKGLLIWQRMFDGKRAMTGQRERVIQAQKRMDEFIASGKPTPSWAS